MVERTRYQVFPHGQNSAFVTNREAEEGLSIIEAALAARNGAWEAPSALDQERAKGTDIRDNMEKSPVVLRIEDPAIPQLSEKLDAGLQLANVLDRTRGIFNGVILGSGSCTVFVTEEGKAQLESVLSKQPQMTR